MLPHGLYLKDKAGAMVKVPSRLVLCDCCEGKGQVENPAFENGFASSEWAEMDEEAQDRYMSGAYDVVCSECKGTGRLTIPDFQQATYAERRLIARDLQDKRFDAQVAREMAAEVAAERAFGC